MRIMKYYAICLILLSLLIQTDQLFGNEGRLNAGTGKVNITPKSSEQLHDSLYARSLVLDLNGERLAFVSVDLGIYTSENLEKICKEKYGITQLMLCSSHTHSGPKDSRSKYIEDQIVNAVDLAARHMFPAKICAGRSSFPQLGFNRLIVREDGHSRESWFPDNHYTSENPERIPFGPVDPEVGVIQIEDMKGEARVIIMNYACHADIVCFNYAISADYPGVACRKVEEAYENKVNCLFVQGAGGNIESLIISSRRTGPDDSFQTDYKTIERVGGLLAYETVKLARSLKHESSDSTEIKYLDDSLKFVGRFNKSVNFNVNISTILINKNIVIATCPGEPFIQLQLDWKKKIEEASGNPFLFGYTWYRGTWPNYIADIKSAAQGGYGADQDSPTLIQIGAGESIMNKHFENYFRLNGLMRDKSGPVGFTPGSRWIMTEIPRKN
jgi:neutral ceramidase